MRNETRRASHTQMWVSMQRRPTRDIDAEREIQNGIAMDMFQRIAQVHHTAPSMACSACGPRLPSGCEAAWELTDRAFMGRKMPTASTSQPAM